MSSQPHIALAGARQQGAEMMELNKTASN